MDAGHTTRLLFFRSFAGLDPDAIVNTVLLDDAWSRRRRMMFRMVDPGGYRDWEERTEASQPK
jgi:hypothetical protein